MRAGMGVLQEAELFRNVRSLDPSSHMTSNIA
jgi:hypothetical protein